MKCIRLLVPTVALILALLPVTALASTNYHEAVSGIETGARNHGAFVSGVAHLTNSLKSAGLISGAQKGAIQSAAAHSH